MSSNAITISGSKYTLTGTVKNQANNEGILDLHVLVYDKDILRDDFLGIAVTDANGVFSLSFESSKFKSFIDWNPDLYFIVKDAGTELLNTKNEVIKNADESTPAIHLKVDMVNDKLRKLINNTPASGWKGGFAAKYPYPPQGPNQDIPPNFDGLDMEKNRTNIDKLTRQQKVLWPEFSWNSEPDNEGDKKRCYQMFAPDISRIGYTDTGKIYSIICPQQGITSSHLGSMNVEVTVTGNKGWINEDTRELAGYMTVEGRIWFSPSAHKHKFVRLLSKHFIERKLPFPSDKANAIVIKTHIPGNLDQAEFPFTNGLTKKFPIPDFAKHEGIAWTKGHLGVEIGAVVKTGIDKVDKFNQLIVDIFNTGAGNMLKEGNVLTWNVWFTAPELVNQEEWSEHTEKWRKSIDADHGSPEGEGTSARYFDGTPFKPLEELLKDELPKIIAYAEEHLVKPTA